MKKWIARVLAVAMTLSLVTTSLAVTPSFSDIPDEATRQEVDLLRMMGIVSGDEKGNFNPTGTLTRAQFCKMVIETMGRGEEETLYRTRTLFPDVRSTHWARGYVNMAATMTIGSSSSSEEGGSSSTGTKLIRGMSDGTFQPDRAITYAEAVTILMRTLGYDDASVGMLWPDGYLNLAAELGLTEGLSLQSGDSLTRAQAAHLFCNLLDTKTKDGQRYINTLGTAKDSVIILAADVKGEDGQETALRTSDGTYTVASGITPDSIVGRRGTLVLNAKNQAIAFFPDSTEQKQIVVRTAQATWLVGEDGVRHYFSGDTVVYTDNGETTYEKLWLDLAPGSKVTLFFTDSGKVDSLYANVSLAEDAVIVTGGVSSAVFLGITGGQAGGYRIYRNSFASSLSEIRKYDVATYDASSAVLQVSSQHITGRYENAKPNPQSPTSIQVLGHEFPVMSTAIEALSDFKIGQEITILLTQDGQVAGAVSPDDYRAEVIGLVNEISSTSVKITLLNGLEVESTPNPDQDNLDLSELKGQLVSLTSPKAGVVNLYKISGRNVKEPFNVKTMRMGESVVTQGVALYERVGASELTPITLDDLLLEKVPLNKLAYVHYNTDDQVDTIIFRDVTGDRYTYGFISYDDGTGGMGDDEIIGDPGGDIFLPEATVTVENSGKYNKIETPLLTSDEYKDGAAAGLVASKYGTVAASVMLKSLKNVSRHDFFTKDGVTYVTVDKVTYRVSDEVECYNNLAKVWFDSLTEARAFSDNLTLYYDRAPEEGGKIRLVVAN